MLSFHYHPDDNLIVPWLPKTPGLSPSDRDDSEEGGQIDSSTQKPPEKTN